MSPARLCPSNPLRGSRACLSNKWCQRAMPIEVPQPFLRFTALVLHLLIAQCSQLVSERESTLVPRTGPGQPHPLNMGISREQTRVPLSTSSLLAEPSLPGPMSTAITFTEASQTLRTKCILHFPLSILSDLLQTPWQNMCASLLYLPLADLNPCARQPLRWLANIPPRPMPSTQAHV